LIVDKTYKYEIAPNKTQERQFWESIRAANFVYNLVLEQIRQTEQIGTLRLGVPKIPKRRNEGFFYAFSANQQDNEITDLLGQVRSDPGDLSFLLTPPRTIFTQVLKDLHRAKKKHGKWKLRWRSNRNNHSFRIQNAGNAIRLNGKRISLQKFGWMRSKENTGKFPAGKPQFATVKREAGRWFVSIQVKETIRVPERKGYRAVGVDVGLKTTMSLSDGTKLNIPEKIRATERAIIAKQKKRDRRLQRLARRNLLAVGKTEEEIKAALNPRNSRNPLYEMRRSRNSRKFNDRLNRKRYRSKAQKRDFYAKAARNLADGYELVAVEDLSIAEMMIGNRGDPKRRRMARSVARQGWGELLQKLEYKTVWRGATLYKADRGFPSTQLCSGCGDLNGPKGGEELGRRIWICKKCGALHDRDINAAINLREAGLKVVPEAVGELTPAEISERGLEVGEPNFPAREEVADAGISTLVPPVNQEQQKCQHDSFGSSREPARKT
jgi:putative transposase